MCYVYEQNEKSRIQKQSRSNEDGAKLERIRIDNAMKKVEDHMSDEQKRLRKESDERVDKMVRRCPASTRGFYNCVFALDVSTHLVIAMLQFKLYVGIVSGIYRARVRRRCRRGECCSTRRRWS
jgi:hypothetical protein